MRFTGYSTFLFFIVFYNEENREKKTKQLL